MEHAGLTPHSSQMPFLPGKLTLGLLLGFPGGQTSFPPSLRLGMALSVTWELAGDHTRVGRNSAGGSGTGCHCRAGTPGWQKCPGADSGSALPLPA